MASATMTARFCNLPADKREHITTAATTEFARHGYEQANTNRIAKEADTSVGVPFKYFPTKADLFIYRRERGRRSSRRRLPPVLESDAGCWRSSESLWMSSARRAQVSGKQSRCTKQ
ncbi:helix-turn-helix domain-containing protein [Corynebacterium glucuronolyticum]|uniref:TetR/AcrR family transcriptional regulator n=1 Tax=Corynebacterium glucuronolyticum TaxID=39791 RepID=UPI0030843063